MEHVLENRFDSVLVIIRCEYLNDEDGDENVEQVVKVNIVLELYMMVKLDEDFDTVKSEILLLEQNFDLNNRTGISWRSNYPIEIHMIARVDPQSTNFHSHKNVRKSI